MMNYFLWKGLLLLALGEPTSFKISQDKLWISKKNLLSVQSLPSQLMVLPKERGLVYVSGIHVPNSGLSQNGVHKVLVVTAQNLLALKRCSSIPHLEITEGGLSYSALPSQLPPHCGFDDLSFKDSFLQKSLPLKKEFQETEKNLSQKGLKISQAQWKKGKRHLDVYSSSSFESFSKRISPKFLPFYEFNFKRNANTETNLIFELTLFEFSRKKAQKIGIKWPQNITLLSVSPAGVGQKNFLTLKGDTAEEILLSADFGESQGVGKVLAKPTLRTKPGVLSSFMSGGEIPIKNSNAFQSNTTWKSYGLKLELTPSVHTRPGDQEVSLDFKLEFSEPDPEHAIDGIPGMLQRQLQSKFDLRMNELSILTTMVILREGKAREGPAIFSQIPIFSLLFAQNARDKSDSELCFALKPTWDEIAPPQMQKRNVKLDTWF
jgi:hypothetical protein